MILGVIDRDRLAELIASADQEAELKFVVEALARADNRHLAAAFGLTERPADRLAADNDGRRTPVVADRHPFVIGQQRRIGAEQPAHRRRMVDAGIEIGVIADLAGQRHLHRLLRQQAGGPCSLLLAAGLQSFRQGHSQPLPRRLAHCHEAVHIACGQRFECALQARRPAWAGGGQLQVEQLVADRHSGAQSPVGPAKASERQVLDREIGLRLIGRIDPALHCRVMAGVKAHRHSCLKLSARPSQQLA